MKFYYVYILYNNRKNFIYVGYSEDLKERRIAWDREVMGRLNARRQTLLQELTAVEGQIRGVEADISSLQKGSLPTESPLDYEPENPLNILKRRISRKPSIDIPIRPVRPYE